MQNALPVEVDQLPHYFLIKALMGSLRHTWQDKPLIIILMILFILLICLLLGALLVRSGVLDELNGIIGVVPTVEVTETPSKATPTPKATITKTATPLATATITPSPSPWPLPSITPSNTATPQPPQTASPLSPRSTATQVPITTANLVRDGDFERDIHRNSGWNFFNNGGAIVRFNNERWPQAIRNGNSALRITIEQAQQPDRFAGIYQQVAVIPGQPYTLQLHGQIRSQFGDVSISQYGYRLYYAIDEVGRTNWRSIPETNWHELPWDEQSIDDGTAQFLHYETTVVPPSNNITLFIRAHNKWPLENEAQFTLDDLSLVGPVRLNAPVNQGLPTTGNTDEGTIAPNLWFNSRLWLTLILFVALVIATLKKAMA